jgi:16S rRNA (uracil1498-N3)-methyltransferase
MRRFYIPAGQLEKDESIITGSDAHHMRDVLRLQPDDWVVVFDGTGRQYQAQIISVDRKGIRVAMRSPVKADIIPAFELALAQGYLKDKKMDGLVRQLTELGVDRWVPFLSRRSIPVPNQKRLQGRYQRWQKISFEALKQCGRSRAMELDTMVSFGDALKQARSYDLKIIFWEESKAATFGDHLRNTDPARVFLMVGPEGGFGSDEIEMAESEGFRVVGLGPRILKAETAALAAAVLVQCIFGDMG